MPRDRWQELCSLGTGGRSYVAWEQMAEVMYPENRWSGYVSCEQVAGVM
jgi:hypothetical protein